MEKEEIKWADCLTCDNCGKIIERGIVSVSTHAFECKARVTTKLTETFSSINFPSPSFTETFDAEFEEVKPLMIEPNPLTP